MHGNLCEAHEAQPLSSPCTVQFGSQRGHCKSHQWDQGKAPEHFDFFYAKKVMFVHAEAVFARIYDTQNVHLPLICFHFGKFEESVNWEVAGYRLLRTLVNTLTIFPLSNSVKFLECVP